MKKNTDNEPDKKEIRRKKLQEKIVFKEDKQEPTVSRSLKKEFKKKKEEIEEEEWEDWERFYNR